MVKRVIVAVTVPETFTIIGRFPEFLRDHGWSVVLLSSPGSYLDDLETRGFDVERVSMARDPLPLADLLSLVGVRRVLKRYPDSIILAGTPKASLLVLGASRTVGGFIRVYDVKGLRYEGEVGARRAFFRFIETVTMALSDHTLAISPSIRRRIVEERLVRLEKLRLLGHGADNGVDTDCFSNEIFAGSTQDLKSDLGIADGDTVVGYIGRVTEDKGLVELAEVAKRSRVEGKKITYVVVGPEDSANFQPFSASDANVIRVGWVDDPRPYFGIFDIFCLPTYREGLPNVNLQAAAMAVPVVTTDATGAIDTVVSGQTGYVVPVRAPQALYDAIVTLHEDPKLARRLGEQGRDWVRGRYDSKKVWEARLNWLDALWASKYGR